MPHANNSDLPAQHPVTVRIVPSLSAKGQRRLLWLAGLFLGLDLFKAYLSYMAVADTLVMWLDYALWFLVVLVGLLIVELLGLYQAIFWGGVPKVAVERQSASKFAIGVPMPVTLNMSANIPSWLRVRCHDSLPVNGVASGLPICLTGGELAQNTTQNGISTHYLLTLTTRGSASFGDMWWEFSSYFASWCLYAYLPKHNVQGQKTVQGLPDFGNRHGQLIATSLNQAFHGNLQKSKRGVGQDFHQLRDYNEGDNVRAIDWKASSRLQKLMSKDYQEQNNQTLLFLLDGSMRMRHQSADSALSHLDAVLNAMLALAMVALKQGDKVGFVSFSSVEDKVFAPQKGVQTISQLLAQSANLQASHQMPDYMAAAKIALSVQKKRGWIILLTSTRSEDMDELLEAVGLLRARHLVVVATLYEDELAQRLEKLPINAESARTYQAICDHTLRQKQLQSRLRGLANVITLHCTPEQLAHQLMQQYWTLKKR